jgi:hypothetical protein
MNHLLKNRIFPQYWLPFLLFIISLCVTGNNLFHEPHAVHWDVKYERFLNTEVLLHSLHVLNVYEKCPIERHLFLPYHGDGFYPSFYSTLFVVPYLVLQLFQAPMHLSSLLVFIAGLKLLTTYLVFYCAERIAQHCIVNPPLSNTWHHRSLTCIVASLTTAAFLFNTNVLETYTNVYWAHQLGWMVTLAWALCLLNLKNIIAPWKQWCIFLIPASVLMLTYWSGLATNVIVILGLWLIPLVRSRKILNEVSFLKTRPMQATVAIILATIISLSWIVTHFLMKVSWSRLINALQDRAIARSFAPPYASTPELIRLFKHALTVDMGYLAYATAAIVFVVVFYALFNQRSREEWGISRVWFLVFVLLCLPCLESAVLLEHDFTYNFGRLKWLMPLLFVLTIGLSMAWQHCHIWVAMGLSTLLTVSLVGHTITYLDIHNPANYTLQEKEVGEIVVKKISLATCETYVLDKLN